MDPHYPHSSPRTKIRDTMSKPASSYLQEHLLARRGHGKPARRSDFGPRRRDFDKDDDDLFIAEAEAEAGAIAAANAISASAKGTTIKDKRDAASLGARELDKHLDRVSKMNFDLKMEVFHCRERMNSLQQENSRLTAHNEMLENTATRAERLARERDQLAQDRQTLISLNEDMVKELEKRDEAVKEAVSIICDLEEKVETLEQSSLPQTSRLPHTPSPNGNPAKHRNLPAPKNLELLSPTSTMGMGHLPTSKLSTVPQKRVPSFMCEKKPSTNALRSVYLEPSAQLRAVKSYASILSREDESPHMDPLDSPQLSVLSESSFPSIYSPRKRAEEQDDDEQGISQPEIERHALSQTSYDRYRSDNSRIDEWVKSRIPRDAPPAQQPQPRSRQTSSELHYQSLDDPSMYTPLKGPFNENSAPVCTKRSPPRPTHMRNTVSSADGQSYRPGLLPPTPESASTRLLRQSYSTLADSRSVTDRSEQASSSAALRRQISSTGGQESYGFPASSSDCPPLSYHTAPRTKYHGRVRDVSPSEEDMDVGIQAGNADDSSETLRDIGEGYAMYSDGGSIITGTPSRFQIRHACPPADDLLRAGQGDGNVERPRGKRRNTGSDARDLVSSPPRHSLPRSETSPSLLATGGQQHNINKDRKGPLAMTQQEKPNPPKRRLSTRLSLQRSPPKQDHKTPPSNSPSMRIALTQKTQKLFRRMSDSGRGDVSMANRIITTTANPKTSPASPTRPSTANPSGKSMNHNSSDISLDYARRQSVVRPASHDRDLALVAANQAIASRQIPHQPDNQSSGKGSLAQLGTIRGSFFKRAGSVRR